MNTFTLEIWYDEGNACTFYTVNLTSNDRMSETDKFFDKYAVSGHLLEEKALMLFRLITESIGNRYGAIDDFFDRHANRAQELPPKPKKRVEEIKNLGINFPLRLFCYRITKQIVVLFNGGVKESQTLQDSNSLRMKFQEAEIFVRKIEDAMRSGLIEVSEDNRYLENFDGTEEITIF